MEDKNKDDVWQKLSWPEKVQICQQAIAHEDNLSSTYRTIFVALEAMFFAIVLSMDLCLWLTIAIAGLGILTAVLFIGIFERRGNAVDRWGEILNSLWAKVDPSKVSELEKGVLELAQHYEGSVNRRKRRRGKYGQLAVVFGWGGLRGRQKSARWIIVTLAPLLIILGWILVTVVTVTGVLDC